MLTENLLEDARSIAERITALRRAIHAEPELGLDTPKTLAKVRAELADLPLEWREGPSCTGAVAVLNVRQERAQRAPARRHGRAADAGGDRPALRLDHAGTDARLRARHAYGDAGGRRAGAQPAARRALPGEVRFMFQPGEEGYHGARFMIDDGLLDPLPRRRVRAPHHAQRPARRDRQPRRHAAGLGRHAGDRGRGARRPCLDAARHARPGAGRLRDRHGAPGDGDAALQGHRGGRRDDHNPIDSGTAHNVIPDKARLKGTIRTLSPEARATIASAIQTLAENIAQAHECDADVAITKGFPPTVNDARAVALAEAVATSLPHGEYLPLPAPIMGAEDFSYVLEKVPGMMAFLGVAKSGADLSNVARSTPAG